MHVSESNIARITSALPVLFLALAACANATYGDAYPANGDQGGPSASEGGGAPLVDGDGSAVAGAFSIAGSVGTVGDTGGQSAPSAAGSSSLGFAGAGGSASAAGGSAGATAAAGSSSTAGVCSAPAWVPNMVYRMGDKASKSGKEYTAAFYTMADPDSHCCGNGADWASSIPCP
jgi:hypothetical protein